MAKKGVSVFLGTVIIVMLTVLIAAMVANWAPQTAKALTRSVEDQNTNELVCARGRFLINNVSYNCSHSCTPGTKQHTLNMTVENMGALNLVFRNVSIITVDGRLFSYQFNETKNLTIDEKEEFVNVSLTSCEYINNSIQDVVLGARNCGKVVDYYPGEIVTYIECD